MHQFIAFYLKTKILYRFIQYTVTSNIILKLESLAIRLVLLIPD